MLKDLFCSVTNQFASSRYLSKSLLELPFPDDSVVGKSIHRSSSIEKKECPWPGHSHSSKSNSLPHRAERRHSQPKVSLSPISFSPIHKEKSPTHKARSPIHKAKSPTHKAKSLIHKTKTTPTHILVVGAPNVGKSALTVRYITRRYIGEYMTGGQQTYHHYVNEGERQLELVFRDEFGRKDRRKCLDGQLTAENLSWADGVIVVYDVGDLVSFDYAKRVVRLLAEKELRDYAKIFPESFMPVLLLGNKTDIVRRRVVKKDDVRNLIEKHSSWLSGDQVSVAEEYEGVARNINCLIARIEEQMTSMQSVSTMNCENESHSAKVKRERKKQTL